MKLYNCYSEVEKRLADVDLEAHSTGGLMLLAKSTKEDWDTGLLEDEEIVISALVQIAEELGRRCE